MLIGPLRTHARALTHPYVRVGPKVPERPLAFAGLSLQGFATSGNAPGYSTTMRSLAPRPKVSGWYISSAFGGGTTNVPGVVARAT